MIIYSVIILILYAGILTMQYIIIFFSVFALLIINKVCLAQSLGSVKQAPTEVTGLSRKDIDGEKRNLIEHAITDVQPQDFLSSSETISELVNQKIDVGALINKAFKSGISRVRIPCGNYLITTTIQMSGLQTLMGDGMCTALYSTIVGDDVIDVSGAFNTIRDIRINNMVTKTGGNVIFAHKTFHLVIDHIDIDAVNTHTYWWNGIVLYGANDTHINDSEMRPAGKNAAIQLSGTQKTGRSEDTYITHTNINGWKYALELSWASGNYLSNMDLLSATEFGVIFDPESWQEVDGTRASQILSDSNTKDGWRFDGVGAITETSLTNCWGSTNGYQQGSSQIVALADGLHVVNPNTDNLTVLASEFHSNTAHGIEIDSGQNILISSNTIFMNGIGGQAKILDTSAYKPNSYSGIFIHKPVSYISVTNNIGGLGGVRNASAINHQKYLVSTESSNYVTISLNIGNHHWGESVVNANGAVGKNIILNNNNGN